MSKPKSRCLRIGSTLDLISPEYSISPAFSPKLLGSHAGKLSCLPPGVSTVLPLSIAIAAARYPCRYLAR
jgi:hypothetical protein